MLLLRSQARRNTHQKDFSPNNNTFANFLKNPLMVNLTPMILDEQGTITAINAYQANVFLPSL